jgi:hypothetical protein
VAVPVEPDPLEPLEPVAPVEAALVGAAPPAVDEVLDLLLLPHAAASRATLVSAAPTRMLLEQNVDSR